MRTFTANVPQTLINGLIDAGLVEVRTTLMEGGVTATENRFYPAAAAYVAKLFKEVTDPIQH